LNVCDPSVNSEGNGDIQSCLKCEVDEKTCGAALTVMKQQYGREISLGEKLIVFASSHITNRLQPEKYGLSHRFRGYISNLVFDFEDTIDGVPVGLTDIYLQPAPIEVTETVIFHDINGPVIPVKFVIKYIRHVLPEFVEKSNILS